VSALNLELEHGLSHRDEVKLREILEGASFDSLLVETARLMLEKAVRWEEGLEAHKTGPVPVEMAARLRKQAHDLALSAGRR